LTAEAFYKSTSPHYIQDLHIHYPVTIQHNELWTWRITSECFNTWKYRTHTTLVNSKALNTTAAFSNQLEEFLAHQITAEIKRISGNGKIPCEDGKHHQIFLYQDGIPDSKKVNGPTFDWGTKCNQRNG
jgi:hypothetical protein